MADTNQFLSNEVNNYEDVKPELVEATQVLKTVESSPKTSRGVLGIFKKPQKEEEETIEPDLEVTDTVIKEVEESVEIVKERVQTEIEKVVVQTDIEKAVKSPEEGVESSPKSSRGLFGIFKKTKKDSNEEASEVKPISEVVLRNMKETTSFLTGEVENYHDVKPEKFEPIEKKITTTVEDAVEASPKSARGLFGMFKKPKKDEDVLADAKIALSKEVQKEIVDTDNFISVEVENYEDAKEVKSEVEEAAERTAKISKGIFGMFKKSKTKDEEESVVATTVDTVTKEMEETKDRLTNDVDVKLVQPLEEKAKVVEEKAKEIEEKFESQLKTSRGLFGIFKSPKKDKEDSVEKTVLSEETLQNMADTTQFLTEEVQNYHDVKSTFEEKKIPEETKSTRESSPRPASGIFSGIFKKSKKESEEAPDLEVSFPETVAKDDKQVTIQNLQAADKVIPVVSETETQVTAKTAEESKQRRESSPRPTSGIFSGIFKKSKKESEDAPELEILLPETVVKHDKQVTIQDLQVTDEVKPAVSEAETLITAKVTEESKQRRESSPRPTSGIFSGIFKKSKKESEEVSETEVLLPEAVAKDVTQIIDEVKPVVADAEVDVKVSEELKKTRESSPKPTSGIFSSIFKKSKKEEEEIGEITSSLSETGKPAIADDKQVVIHDVTISEEIKPTISDSEVQISTKVEVAESEIRPEVKGGFLSKFKKTKKKPEPETQLSEEVQRSVPEIQLSNKVQKSLDETKTFLSMELEHYEDALLKKAQSPDKDKKEEKTVTFDETITQMVLEGQLPQSETAQVVEVVKTEVADIEEDDKETGDVILQEATAVQAAEVPVKKDKQGKEKKGFFQRFGKSKSKGSQEASFDEGKLDEGESSPKKQKRRKSSSPFKFFDKMKKSEEELKEPEQVIPAEIEDAVKEEIKDDLLAVEFEQEPAMDLSAEVLESLDKKIEALKSKYTPEIQKEINDCRDFLFIEVDNYDNAKPVVVTDIDTGLTTDAGKAVDDIIDQAAKVVEDTKAQVISGKTLEDAKVDIESLKNEVLEDTTTKIETPKTEIKIKVEAAKTETVENVAKIAAQVEESAKKSGKKTEKKSGGFFSKLGNLISGTVDETKSDLKEAKKSVEKASGKAAESTGQAVDSAVKGAKDGVDKINEKLEDTQKAASEKVEETKTLISEKVETIKESAIDHSNKKVDEAKQEVITLKESLLEAKSKTGEIKTDITLKTKAIVTEVQEAKDTAEKKVSDIVDTATSKIEDFKTDAHEDINKKSEEFEKTKQKLADASKETTSEVKKDVAAVFEKVGQTKTEAIQKLDKIASKADIKAKTEDLSKTKDDVTQMVTQRVEEAGFKIDAAKKDAEVKIVEQIQEVKDQVQQNVELAKGKTQEQTDQLAAAKDKFVDDINQGIKERVSDLADKKETAKESLSKKVDDVSKTLDQKVEDLTQTKDTFVEDLSNIKTDLKKSTDQRVQEVQKAKETVTAAAVCKVEELSKTASKKITHLETVKTDATESMTQKVDELYDVKSSGEQSLVVKVGEAKGAVTQKVDEAAQIKDAIRHTADQKLEDLSSTVDNFKKDFEYTAEEKGQQFQKAKEDVIATAIHKVDDIKNEASKKRDELETTEKDVTTTVAQKADEIGKAKENAEQAVLTKVDDVKDAVAQKVEKTKDLASQELRNINKTKDSYIEVLGDTKTGFKKSTEDEMQKIRETTESIVEVATYQVDKLGKSVSKKADDFDATKKDVATSVAQKVDNLQEVKEISKKPVAAKAEEAKKAVDAKVQDLNMIKGSLCGTLDDIKKDITKSAEDKVDKIQKSKECIVEAGASKVDQLSKATSKKIDDLEAEKVDDFQKVKDSTEQMLAKKAGEVKDAVTHKIKENKDATEQKLQGLLDAKKSIFGALDDVKKDFESTAESKVQDIQKSKEAIITTSTSKIDDVSKATSKTLKELEATKKEVVTGVTQKVDDLQKTKVVCDQTLSGKSTEVKSVVTHKVQEGEELKDALRDAAGRTVEGIKESTAQKITNGKQQIDSFVLQKADQLEHLQQSTKDAVAQKLDDAKKIGLGKIEEVKDSKTAIQTEALKRSEDFSKHGSEKIIDPKKQTKDVFEHKVDDLSKSVGKKVEGFLQEKDNLQTTTKECASEISTRGAHVTQTSIQKLKGEVETVQQVDKKLDDLMKAKDGVFADLTKAKKDVSGLVDDGKKSTVTQEKQLDDQLAELTSSLELLIEPGVQDFKKVKSYVTSPTMARRAESQRFSREERATVCEVRTPQLDNEDYEGLYTVTEPEEVEANKRKPLFHIESEDDDSADITKAKDRRDSVKSNVLETLSEKKLDNLLSDLELQMVKDLEKSVAEGGKVVSTDISKAETELETMKKDSQADVEQIEQKLRDLDKALDSLEQASDPKLEKKLHRVERKFERMASEVIETDVSGVSPTEVEARRENEFQKLVSQLSTEEVSDFQKEYSQMWDETTFSKSDDWDSKTPDSQVDVQELPQGEVVYMGPVTLNKDNLINKAGVEVDVIPIMRSPCHTPRPTKKNKRAKSAMDFYEESSPPKEFDRGSLPDLKRTSLKSSLISTIVQLNPDRFLYGSTTSLRSTASSSSDLSRGEIMNAVLDWLDKSNHSEISVESTSIASSDSNLSAKTNPTIPAIRVTKGHGKKRPKSKGQYERRGEESSFAATTPSRDSALKAEGDELGTSGQQTDRTLSQQRVATDQHQLSEEMKQLLKELEKESKQ